MLCGCPDFQGLQNSPCETSLKVSNFFSFLRAILLNILAEHASRERRISSIVVLNTSIRPNPLVDVLNLLSLAFNFFKFFLRNFPRSGLLPFRAARPPLLAEQSKPRALLEYPEHCGRVGTFYMSEHRMTASASAAVKFLKGHKFQES